MLASIQYFRGYFAKVAVLRAMQNSHQTLQGNFQNSTEQSTSGATCCHCEPVKVFIL